MAHFYDCSDMDSLELKEEITTPTQAKKYGAKIYPSVTTVISSTIRDPFLDVIHKPRYLQSSGRSSADIPSSEFGTRVHKCAEKLLDAYRYNDEYEEDEHYDPYAMPFLDWVKERGHKVIATEYMVADKLIKLCGSVDVILKGGSSGKMMICDYKCRKSKQFYDKDLWQLAIESEMLRRKGLDYRPSCVSVCIDVTTKKHHHKLWSDEEVEDAIQIMKWISKLYWKIRMS